MLSAALLPARVHAEVGACGTAATPIHDIQGSGTRTGMIDQPKVIEGVVVGDFQKTTLSGFYVQEEDAQQDADPATSEGMFIYQGTDNTTDVSVGQLVRVAGYVTEFDGTTELTHITRVAICPGNPVASPVELRFPLRERADLEHYEGMLVNIAQPLTVSGNYLLARYGTLELSAGGRLLAPTQLAAKGEPARALTRDNDLRLILLDDADGRDNPKPIPYKSSDNTRRVGDTLPNLRGVLDDRFDAYRINPVEPPQFETHNPRPPAPVPAGRLRVASANVLNYFTTLDDRKPHCGPGGNQQCRGANSAEELARQRAKLVTALQAINADVLGLLEIENNPSASVSDVVTALNTALGHATYAFIDTGTIGQDVTKVALLYKPERVALRGSYALLDSRGDARFIDTKNRPVLAQTFEEVATGARFTLALNHWKSKSTACDDVKDPDLGDGQGNCNLTRTSAANALLDWLARDPTASEDPDRLILGDLNAYAQEDPILTLERGGYASLVAAFAGQSGYSFQFNGESGYLDHAFASASLKPQVAKVIEWHINADEPLAADYNLEFRPDDLFDPSTPYRMSDHDPLIIDLNLTGGGGPATTLPRAWTLAAVPLLFILAWIALRIWQRRRG